MILRDLPNVKKANITSAKIKISQIYCQLASWAEIQKYFNFAILLTMKGTFPMKYSARKKGIGELGKCQSCVNFAFVYCKQ
jgi:hypothetical protein